MFKRILKLAISGGFFTAALLKVLLLRLGGKSPEALCVVLYYHSVPLESRNKFARQMDTLVRWTNPIAADSRAPLSPGTLYSAVTFDDGFESFLENALPELERREIPSTVFVVTGSLGRSTDWAGYPEKIMSRDQLLQLPSRLVTIGSHTVTHPVLPNVSEEVAKCELAESREQLEESLQRRITLFSFPYGAFNEALVKCCKAVGYERVFTTLAFPAFADPRQFTTGRVCVEPTDWHIEFLLKIFGAYRWLPLAFSLKRKLPWSSGASAMVWSKIKANATSPRTMRRSASLLKQIPWQEAVKSRKRT
jgi:peptidoglycan/xylan/chitin deacetylase (PgdA/CDA1 family)